MAKLESHFFCVEALGFQNFKMREAVYVAIGSSLPRRVQVVLLGRLQVVLLGRQHYVNGDRKAINYFICLFAQTTDVTGRWYGMDLQCHKECNAAHSCGLIAW